MSPCVQKRTVSVASYSASAFMCLIHGVCLHTFSTRVEKTHRPRGPPAGSRESVQSETEKSRVSRRGCPDMKACRNGDNRLWIDEWRPVN